MINTANISKIGKTKPYLFADFSELLLLTQGYEELSRSNLADLLVGDDSGSLTSTSIVVDGDESFETLKTQSELEIDGDWDFLKADLGDSRISGYVQDCFDHLDYRQAALKKLYPYELSNDLLRMKTAYSTEQLVYFFLLCSSQLGRFNSSDGIRQRCAATFTKLSAAVLETLLSPFAKVYIFDANSEHRRTIFGTDKRAALKKLAKDFLFEAPMPDAIDKEDPSGDFGIDLVGVFPFSHDKASGRFTVLGQCAARKEGWEDKTLDASPLRLSPFINFNHDPANLMFIPLLYRDTDGSWFKSTPLGGCVLIDRLRILHCLDSIQSLPRELRDKFLQHLDELRGEVLQRLTELGFGYLSDRLSA